MRKLLSLCLISFLVVVSVKAQEDNTLFNSTRDFTVSGFGGPIFSAMPVNNSYGLAFGGGGGVVINNFFIGGFGIGNYVDNSILEVNQTAYDVDIAYGGLWFGYSIKDEWLVHPFVSLRSGFGGVELYETTNDDVELMRENMVVLTPEIGVEVNIFQQLKLSTTFGYRWLSNFDNNLLRSEDYTGVIGSIALRFGGF